MEGQGYQNWGRSTYGSGGKYSRFSNEGDDSMYADSSVGYSDYDTSYIKKSRKEDRSDAYDFEISQDDDFMVESPEVQRQPVKQKSSTSTASYASSTGATTERFGGVTRRSSVEDRAKEILERNRSKARESKASDDSERFTTFEQQFAEILEGIEIPKMKDSQDTLQIKESISSPKGIGGSNKRPADSPMDSINGDSFDISAADFEVGAIAAKRVKEKAAERGRRMSFDQTAYASQKDSSFLNAKNSASPDVKARRSSMPDGFQMSTALSSIHKSRTSMPELDKKGDFNKYGSVERSDDDIYKMLNISAVNESYEKYSKLSNLDRESGDAPLMRREDGDMSAMTNESADNDYGFRTNKAQELSGVDESYNDDNFDESEGPALRDNKNPLNQTQTEDEYEMDDFEQDQSTSHIPIKLPESNVVAEKKEPEPQKPPVQPVTSTTSMEMGGLTTVEQIMQRWAYTDPSKISLDWIGTKHQSNDDDDEKLKHGILPSYMESPSAKREKEISKADSNTTTEVFAGMQEPTNDENAHEHQTNLDEDGNVENTENNTYEEDFDGSLSVSSTSENAANKLNSKHSSKQASKRNSPSENDDNRPASDYENNISVPVSAALLSAVGTSTLVTSIPPAPPVMSALSIPTWSAADQLSMKAAENRESRPIAMREEDSTGYDEYKRHSEDEESRHSRESRQSKNEFKNERTEDSDLLLPKPSNRSGNRSRAGSDIILPTRSGKNDTGSRSSRYQSDSEEDDIRKLRSKSAQQSKRDSSSGKREASSNYYDLREEKEERLLRTSGKNHKMAASTAAKLKQKRSQASSNTSTAQAQKKMTKRLSTPTNRGYDLHPQPSEEEKKTLEQSQKLQRLEKENARLARKFSTLEYELRDMKVSTSRKSQQQLQDEESFRGSRSKSPARRSQSNLQFTKSNRSLFDENYNFVEAITNALEHIQQRSEYLQDQKAEQELQDVVTKLLEQSNQLRDRERLVVVKEKALAIRESVVGVREATSELPFDGANKAFQQLEHKVLTAEKEKLALIEEIKHLREVNMSLTKELDVTKAELMQIKQTQDEQQNVHARESLGLNPHLNVIRTAKPLENLLRELQQEKQKATSYQSQRNANGKGKGKDDNKQVEDPNGEMMSVNRKEFEDFLKEYATQERLIEGFQKENERLTKQLKEREVEEQSRRALYFDQQEELNKELNRLRNLTNQTPTTTAGFGGLGDVGGLGGSVGDDGGAMNKPLVSHHHNIKTAEQLRQELALDTKLRYLQDKIATMTKEGKEQERDYLNQINQLRKENQTLQQLNQTLSNKSMEQLEHEIKVQQDENQRLRHKIQWYLDNQQLHEASNQELTKQRKLIQYLKEELIKKGVLPQTLKTLIDKFTRSYSSQSQAGQQEAAGDDVNNAALNQTQDSIKSSSTSRIPHGTHRSFADIKRIRELEQTVKDLQEAIAKRYPDSVASLIHATKVSDIQQEKQCRLLEHQITSLQEDLQDMQQLHEKRLRSLRLEHERVKAHYEGLLKDMEEKLKSQQAFRVVNHRERGNPSSNRDGEVNSLPQALLRISDLEDEMEKLRHFYTRKIEDMQKRHEAQLRALKRGEYIETNEGQNRGTAGGGGSPVYRQHVTLGGNVPPPPPPPAVEHQVLEEYQKQIASITKMYSERVALLEKELMNTAEELGRVKANAAKSTQQPVMPSTPQVDYASFKQTSPESPPSVVSRVSKEDVEQLIQERMKKVAADFEHSRVREMRQMELDYQRKFQELQSQTASSQWLIEKEQLLREIGEEKAKSSTLVQEIVFLKKNLEEETKSPTLLQFQIMEKQLEDVEQRLIRRENELKAIIDDVKLSSKMERSRLESIHQQELREKDEQLMQFQLELEKLLLELQRWQTQSST